MSEDAPDYGQPKTNMHQILNREAERIGEQFPDGVLILAAVKDGDTNKLVSGWAGSYFTARGLAQEWMEDNQAQQIAERISQAREG